MLKVRCRGHNTTTTVAFRHKMDPNQRSMSASSVNAKGYGIQNGEENPAFAKAASKTCLFLAQGVGLKYKAQKNEPLKDSNTRMHAMHALHVLIRPSVEQIYFGKTDCLKCLDNQIN